MPNDSLLGDDVDHEIHTDFMESFTITTVPNPMNTVDELKQGRKRKQTIAERTPPWSKTLPKSEISQCVESFTKVAAV